MPTPRNIFLLALIAITAVSAAHAVKPSAKPQEVFAPYWTSEPGWETDLQLKNNLSSGSLTVTPVLRLASGEEIALDPMTITSNASASVQVNEGLLKHSPTLVNQPGSYGSVVFRFTSFHPRNLTASAEVSLHGSPIGFHVAAYPAVDSEPFPGSALAGSREGIWWQPRVPGSDVLVLSNSAQKALPGTLWLSDAAGKRWSKPLPLAAHQTVRLDMRELIASSGLTGQYGGIRFEVPVNAGALGSVHFMHDELAKSSSALEMFTRTTVAAASSAKPWTTRAPMLALRNPDPAVGLPAKTLLQPTILVRNTTARQVAANITLAWRGDSGKGQVKLPPLNMAPFVTQQLQIGAMQKRLGIPDDAHWALVTLTSSTAPNDVIAVASSYDASGRYNLQTPFSPTVAGHFAGGEWRVDAEHNQIIAVTNSGQKPTNALLTLHYDNGQKSYEVQQAIQPGDQMWVNMASLVRNRVPDRNGNVLPTDATFGTYDLRDLAAGLGSLTPGQLGLDSTFGFSIAPPPYPGCCGTSSPDWGVDDFDLSVDDVSLDPIYATDTCNGDSENISGSFSDWWSGNTSIATVTNKAVTGVSVGTTTANAKGVIFLDGCFEDPVQLSNPITVQVPTSLSVLNVTVLPNGQGLNFGCSGLNNYGIRVDTKYQVLDQNGRPILSANMTPHEHGTSFTGGGYDNNIGPTGFTNSTATTAADGTFHDVPFGVCANGAFSSVTATQFITIIMPDGSAPSVRGQTFTATGQSAGHGTLQNSVGDISATR